MKEATDQIFKNMELLLQQIAFDEKNIISRAEKSVEAVLPVISELKQLIIEHEFRDQEEEIFFFKNVKPKFVSALIFNLQVLKIESNKPVGSVECIRKYYHKELYRLKIHYDDHKDFYQYYRTGCTFMDDIYFVRFGRINYLVSEDFSFDLDPKFSTSHDLKVARIMANEKLEKYLNNALAELDINSSITIDDNRKLLWTGSKIALIELLYAFHSVGVFNNSNTDVKQIASYFERVFKVDLGNYYRAFQEMRNRKGIRTRFLNHMKEKLILRMDENDDGEE